MDGYFATDILRNSITWTIENGNIIRFRHDNWLPELGPLKNYHTCPDHVADEILIKDSVTVAGNWGRNKFPACLGYLVLLSITGSESPCAQDIGDR